MPVKIDKRLYTLIGLSLLAVLLTVLLVLLFRDPGSEVPVPEETQPESTQPTQTEPFSPEKEYLSGAEGQCLPGIDVSSHQDEVNWQWVKAAGIKFVMIRLAYRGSIEGKLIPDEMAQAHYRGAKEAGLMVGGYIFTQSINAQEGVEDAEYILELSKDWELDLPLVYDWEIVDKSYRNGNLDKRTLTDTMLAFCQTIENAGQEAMVYFNISNTKENFYLEELTDYGLWLAHYTDKLEFPQRVDMWQYTGTGTVPGIAGDVDMNLYFPRKK